MHPRLFFEMELGTDTNELNLFTGFCSIQALISRQCKRSMDVGRRWRGATNRNKLYCDKEALLSILMFIYNFKKLIEEPGTYSRFNPVKTWWELHCFVVSHSQPPFRSRVPCLPEGKSQRCLFTGVWDVPKGTPVSGSASSPVAPWQRIRADRPLWWKAELSDTSHHGLTGNKILCYQPAFAIESRVR